MERYTRPEHKKDDENYPEDFYATGWEFGFQDAIDWIERRGEIRLARDMKEWLQANLDFYYRLYQKSTEVKIDVTQ